MGFISMFNSNHIQSQDKNCGFENQFQPIYYQNHDPSEEFTFASSDTNCQSIAVAAPIDCLSVNTADLEGSIYPQRRIKLRRKKKLETKVVRAEE